MDGLFIVIAIVIGIVNFAAKQQKQNQKQTKRQGGIKERPVMERQNPMQQWMSNLQQPTNTDINIENCMPSSVTLEENEGIEIEDRSRAGSLDYIEDSQSSESVDYRLIRPEQMKSKEGKAAPNISVMEREKEPVFDLSEDSLLRSIVMAEVLGPPRAIKRSIR